MQNPFTQRLTGQRSGSVVKKNGAKIFGLDLNYVLASASSVWPRLRPQATTNKLQRALNVAARVVSGTHKFDRGLSLLLHTELHWLDVPERVVYIQTRRHGVQLPARSSASVPRGIVPTSRRCRITATSPIRHPTAPGRTAPPAQLLRQTGFLCAVGLEFPARQLAESDYWREQFQTFLFATY